MKPFATDLSDPADPAKSVIFQLKNISKLYPGTVALNNVSLDINAGECHGIIGKNGAGKTTLVKIISGVIPASKGEMIIHGRPCRKLTRRQAKKMGISIVTQEPQVIPEFTVAENLLFPDYPCLLGKKIQWHRMQEKCNDALAQAGFPLDLKKTGGDLSVSEQQLLLVVKAFYVDHNDIVILDEVTTALSRQDQEFLYGLIDRQKEKGKAIIFISHRMSEIIRICDRITVLRDAKKVVSRRKENLSEFDLSRLIVGDAYDTHEIDDAETNMPAAAGSPRSQLLALKNLTLAGHFHHISLSLNRGEVVGLAGLRGSGRTALMKSMAGIHPYDQGDIFLEKERVRFKHPGHALRRGVVYLSENRDHEGLVEILSVKHNITLSALHRFLKKMLIDTGRENQASRRMIDLLDIKVVSYEQEVKTLSGGNRQKVVLARLMTAGPSVYLLDEPTKGIDIGAKTGILTTIRRELARAGGVIMTSPSIEDLMRVCDRIMVLYEGRIVREFHRDEFDQNQIYLTLQGFSSGSADENSGLTEI